MPPACRGRSAPSERRARPGRLVLAVALLVAPTAGAHAQALTPAAAYVGRPLRAVHVLIGTREVTDRGLLDLLETRVGQPLSLAEVRESMAHLFSLGRFQDVRVEAVTDGAGVVLQYTLIPMHRVERVEFRGALELSDRRLRSVLEERFGGTPSLGRAEAAARVLEQLYASAGYFGARITPRVDAPRARDGTVLVFDIAAGRQARIGDIAVEGTPLSPPHELLARLGVVPGRAYDRPSLESRLGEYVASLKGRGHYEASADHTVRVRDDGAVADLTIVVRAGPRVQLSFRGDPLPPDRLEEFVPVRREGSADEDLLEDSGRRIETYLHDQGYWRAKVDHSRLQSDGTLEIVFTVRKGAAYRVEQVELDGNRRVPSGELRLLVTLAPGSSFVESRLDADVAAIERLYRGRGYAGVKIDVQILEGEAGGGIAHVSPRLVIREGPRTLVGRVELEGRRALEEAVLRRVIQSRPGEPYYEPTVRSDREAVLLQYLNHGYQSATVQVRREFSEDRSVVDLCFDLVEGLQSIVDHILVVGNTRTSQDTIERELALTPGGPLGLADLVESQRRLSALGLFRRVSISEIPHGGGARRDLLITVEEAPMTTLGYGGGLEAGKRLRVGEVGGSAVERLEFAPRGFFEIGRRNLWGRNRSVNLFTRISVRRRDMPDDPEEDGRGLGFSEYRVIGTYREPRAFGSNADMLVTAFLEQAIRSSFNFTRKGLNAELSRRLGPELRASGRYSFGRTRLFDERLKPEDELLIDRLFPQVRLSAVSSSIVRDTRDDQLDPASGGLVSVDGEIAARGIGSQVGFVKTFVQTFLYRRVHAGRRVVLATGARLGLATGFPRRIPQTDASGNPILGPDGRPLVTTVRDVPASERFFAGGDTTVRGFALDRLGAPPTINPAGFPKGGNALVVLNAELRLPIWHSLGAVTFLDAGSVFARAGDFDLGSLRGSVGFGLRYRSPIGPLRVDLGFKLSRRELVAGGREPLTALHFSFGQAF